MRDLKGGWTTGMSERGSQADGMPTDGAFAIAGVVVAIGPSTANPI